jgi:hypothetical protein
MAERTYTRTQAALICGIAYPTLRYGVQAGIVPGPDRGENYSVEGLLKLVDFYRLNVRCSATLTMEQAAKELGIWSGKLRQMAADGDFPEDLMPTKKGRRYFWTREQLPGLKTWLKSREAERLSLVRLSDVIKVPVATIGYHTRAGNVPGPDIKGGRRNFYSPERAEEVQRWFANPDNYSPRVAVPYGTESVIIDGDLVPVRP